MSKEICRECLITRSFRPSNVPLKYDYKRVSNRDDNKILESIIVKLKSGGYSAGSFCTILVDGARYRITIIHYTKTCFKLKQEYLHFDGKRGLLTPVSARFVIIQK